MKCSICGKGLTDEDKEQCKQCLKYVHKRHMKGDVCYKCDIASRMLLEKLERKGYMKAR
jgi:hypothetical protein